MQVTVLSVCVGFVSMPHKRFMCSRSMPGSGNLDTVRCVVLCPPPKNVCLCTSALGHSYTCQSSSMASTQCWCSAVHTDQLSSYHTPVDPAPHLPSSIEILWLWFAQEFCQFKIYIDACMFVCVTVPPVGGALFINCPWRSSCRVQIIIKEVQWKITED